MDSQLPSHEAERVEFINTAEEFLLHVRKVARRMQERILKVLEQPPPEDAEGRTPPPSLRRLPSRDPPFPHTGCPRSQANPSVDPGGYLVSWGPPMYLPGPGRQLQ
jgi:hypothetical protein